jgi:hypothetical protein
MRFNASVACLLAFCACNPSAQTGEGEGEGEAVPCETTADCGAGLVCVTQEDEPELPGTFCSGTCQPPAELGDTCFTFAVGVCGTARHPCVEGLECAQSFPSGSCVVPAPLGAPCDIWRGLAPRDKSRDGCETGLACGVSRSCIDEIEETPCDDVGTCVVAESPGAEAGECRSTGVAGVAGFISCQPEECPNGNECAPGDVCTQLEYCGTLCAPAAGIGDRCVAFDREGPTHPCSAFIRKCGDGLACVDVLYDLDEFAASACALPAAEGEACAFLTNDGCAEGLTCRDRVCTP